MILMSEALIFKIKDISQFEKKNEGIFVNVFGYEKREIYPIRYSKHENAIDLLYITNEEGNSHYCLINDFSRLVGSQISKHKGKVYFCKNCMNHFNDKPTPQGHQERCFKNEEENINMPKQNTILKFNHFNRKMRVPFVIIADFEALTEPNQRCERSGEKYQKHTPCGVGLLIACSFDDRYNKLVTYRAQSEEEDVAQIFVDKIEKEVREIQNKFKFPKPMKFTKKDAKKFQNATQCWICEVINLSGWTRCRTRSLSFNGEVSRSRAERV